MPTRKPLHPMAAQLIGVGMRALDAGIRAFADSLLAAGQGAAEEVTHRVKRSRNIIAGEPIVEGEPRKRPRKRRRKLEEESEEE